MEWLFLKVLLTQDKEKNLYLKCFQSAENHTVLQSPWSRRLLPGPTCPWCDLPSEQEFLSQTRWQGVFTLSRTMFAWVLFIWHHFKFCWNYRFVFYVNRDPYWGRLNSISPAVKWWEFSIIIVSIAYNGTTCKHLSTMNLEGILSES